MRLIPINVSNTFPSRSRCKKCGSAPNTNQASMSFRRHKIFYKDFTQSLGNPYHTYKIYGDFETCEWVIEIVKLSNKINPRYHKNLCYKDKSIYAVSNPVDFSSCICGKTWWAFKGYNDRPEAINKIARYNY